MSTLNLDGMFLPPELQHASMDLGSHMHYPAPWADSIGLERPNKIAIGIRLGQRMCSVASFEVKQLYFYFYFYFYFLTIETLFKFLFFFSVKFFRV